MDHAQDDARAQRAEFEIRCRRLVCVTPGTADELVREVGPIDDVESVVDQLMTPGSAQPPYPVAARAVAK